MDWTDKVKDIVLGKPKAHTIPVGLNRKQKRVQQSLLRRRAAAAKRRQYEGRGR